MIIILMSLFFLLAELGGLNNYLYQAYLGFFFVTLFLSWKIKNITSWLPSLLFLYLALLNLIYMIVPMEFYKGSPPLDLTVVMGLQILNNNSFIYILMTVIPFLFLTEEFGKNIGASILLLGMIDVGILFVSICRGQNPYWLLNNPAIDAAFISSCIPLFLASVDKKFNYYFYLFYVAIPVFVCFMTKTSTGVLGVGVALSSYYWSKKGLQKIHLLYASVLSIIVASIGYSMQGETLLKGSGRYAIWEHSWNFWQGQHSSLVAPHIPANIGAGLGSFFMYGPSLQLQEAFNKSSPGLDIFFWLHNDWAQILFETGYIGLILTFSVFALAVYKSRKTPAIFASLLTYGAVAFIQMPIRHYLFAIFGVFLLWKSLRSTEKTTGKYTTDKQITKEY